MVLISKATAWTFALAIAPSLALSNVRQNGIAASSSSPVASSTPIPTLTRMPSLIATSPSVLAPTGLPHPSTIPAIFPDALLEWNNVEKLEHAAATAKERTSLLSRRADGNFCGPNVNAYSDNRMTYAQVQFCIEQGPDASRGYFHINDILIKLDSWVKLGDYECDVHVSVKTDGEPVLTTEVQRLTAPMRVDVGTFSKVFVPGLQDFFIQYSLLGLTHGLEIIQHNGNYTIEIS